MQLVFHKKSLLPLTELPFFVTTQVPSPAYGQSLAVVLAAWLSGARCESIVAKLAKTSPGSELVVRPKLDNRKGLSVRGGEELPLFSHSIMINPKNTNSAVIVINRKI
jgi:hypothetical protein